MTWEQLERVKEGDRVRVATVNDASVTRWLAATALRRDGSSLLMVQMDGPTGVRRRVAARDVMLPLLSGEVDTAVAF